MARPLTPTEKDEIGRDTFHQHVIRPFVDSSGGVTAVSGLKIDFPSVIAVGDVPSGLIDESTDILKRTNLGPLIQESETDAAARVLVHFPGEEAFFGSLNPRGSLFESPFNLHEASAQYNSFMGALAASGAQVVEIRKALATLTPKNRLVDLAMVHLTYEFHGEVASLSEDARQYLTADYKRSILERMYPDDLVGVILLRPTVVLEHSRVNTSLRLRRNEVRPVTNLMFMRDQQIVTPRGVVIGNLGSSARQNETSITRALFHVSNIPIVGEIDDPGRLEGGDFFMVNRDTAMLSIGLRSNFEAASQLMENNWVGAGTFVIVHDDRDRHQQRMHLDTVFNVISSEPENVCVMLRDILPGGTLPTRTVCVYKRNERGDYTKDDATFGMELSEYLKTHLKFRIIPVDSQFQAEYGINFINLGNNRIVSVHPGLKALLQENGVNHVEVDYVPFDQCTAMYGAARCCTQVFRRPAPVWTANSEADPVARAVVMVRPDDFGYNAETAEDNSYMHTVDSAEVRAIGVTGEGDVTKRAMAEFAGVVNSVRQAGIDVMVLEPARQDEEPEAFANRPTPDAVFPNNWFTTTATGSMYVFPMGTTKRTLERRPHAVIKLLKENGYTIERVRRVGGVRVPPEPELEAMKPFEGTGAAVIDKVKGVVFGALSQRCSLAVLQRYALEMGLNYCAFDTVGSSGLPVYHTNVVMSVGTTFAVVCFETIVPDDRAVVREALSEKEIIEISMDQMEKSFCGNVLELGSRDGKRHVAMSQTAWDGFTSEQQATLRKHANPIVCPIPTIELIGGGSVRCMLAEVFMQQDGPMTPIMSPM